MSCHRTFALRHLFRAKAFGFGCRASRRPTNYIIEVELKLGFVEGLNNKIRVLQRRAYGLRGTEYPRVKILTCMPPEIGK